ncbi:SigE family RNA polymerase sigma factor [Parafrankia elaeagni]|uniref:SigE family RNA polymerase sigma factor n=1 Tax=Parafrankia elaeagni TaxID=222534 RepID=UPI00039BF75F|nr:SigE family RNA polymerase sigma factor [Parafrankia elaeagni]
MSVDSGTKIDAHPARLGTGSPYSSFLDPDSSFLDPALEDQLAQGRPMAEDRGAAEFQDFFASHHRELARFAYLLTGDHDVADDLTADALTAAWSRWDRVSAADSPIAYVRRIVANLATSRLRRVIRERRGMTMLGMLADSSGHATDGGDLTAAVDLRAALMALPVRKRACVVLRYAFDLSEAETARVLGISTGTVKSQTSKAVVELERLLGTCPDLLPPDLPAGPARRREQAAPPAHKPGARRAVAPRSRRRPAGAGDPAAATRSALHRLRDGEAHGRLRGSES